MKKANPSRRKTPGKLEPIDWREFANDAVLNGNMSTLFQRPASEDPTAYASAEALLEIGKRSRSQPPPPVLDPTEGAVPTGGAEPAVSVMPVVGRDETECTKPTAGFGHTEGPVPTDATAADESPNIEPTVGRVTVVGMLPAVGYIPAASETPTEGMPPSVARRKVRPIRNLEDALTLAGQVLYRAMYGPPGQGEARSCSKGYRGLAAETYLDKDTIRDLIVELKEKGIVRETGTYNPDTRSSKTYEVLSPESAVAVWRAAGIRFVTTGRQRPAFCRQDGLVLTFKPAVR